MPDDNRDYKIQADDHSFQIGQMSGGTVHMPRFVARLGPWGFGGILALAVAAVAIVALVVTSGGDPTETAQGSTGASSAGNTAAGAGTGSLPESDCDLSETSIWIEDAEKRYGPLSKNGVDYYLRRDQSYVWVRTGFVNVDTVTTYPANDNQSRQWVPLFGHEAVAICQDSNENLFFDFNRA